MTSDEYVRLAVDCKDEHSCLLFEDESIASDQIAMFVPSRVFTLSQLKVYLMGFGLTEAEVRVVPLQKRPKNAPFGGYVVTIPLPDVRG